MSDNKRETRTKRMKVHLTPQEHEWIKEKMAQAGMTNMSEFIRRMAMNGYVINADQPELDEILRLMRYTGNNLRQIEKHVRENEPEHMPAVEQMLRNHEEIEDTLGDILRILGKLSQQEHLVRLRAVKTHSEVASYFSGDGTYIDNPVTDGKRM